MMGICRGRKILGVKMYQLFAHYLMFMFEIGVKEELGIYIAI